MKILGIDYGKKRIGIAISDEERKLAFPKIIILNDEKLFPKLEKLITENEISGIVVGESNNLSNEPNQISNEIEVFIKKLSIKFKLSVFKQKEFLTSVEARRSTLTKSDMNKASSHSRLKTKKGVSVDNSAAALILQRYLDKINKK